MNERGEIHDLMQRVRAGSQEAMRELCDLYGPHVRRVVRRRLDKKLRAKLDSADLAQAVWASFFIQPNHDFTFATSEELVAFLASIAHNKLVDVLRQRYRTRKYNINREQSLYGSATDHSMEVTDPHPSPSQIVSVEDRWERLLAEQTPRDRLILQLLRQGHTHEETACMVGVNERTVRRLLSKIDPKSIA